MSDIEDEPPSVLLPCTICSRTFRPEVLSRHVKVCEKTASKKRRVFDSFKNRVSGTELEEFLGPAPLPGQVQKRTVKSPVKKKAPSKWKETHENLIAVLRAARGVQPPPETMVDSTKHGVNEQCPSCNRFFGPRAFDRHVEFCKEKTARIKVTPSKVSQAQERLEARTKYRAPLSVKPKLTTKEKYSPMLPRKESTESCYTATSPTKTSPPIPTLSRNAKTASSTSGKSNTSRTFERQRSVSPNKKTLVSSSKSSAKSEHPTNKSSNPPKIKENLKDPDVLRPKTGIKITPQEKLRSCNVKLVQLEDDVPYVKSKSKQKLRNKTIAKCNVVTSDDDNDEDDDESVAMAEGETAENQVKQRNGVKNKWSSSESVNRTPQKGTRKVRDEKYSPDDERIASARKSHENEGNKNKSKTEENARTGKKPKNPKKQEPNDLSVNDESFGIFVAPCGPPANNAGVRGTNETTEKPPRRSVKEARVRHSDEEVAIEKTKSPIPSEKVKNSNEGGNSKKPKKSNKQKKVSSQARESYEIAGKFNTEEGEGLQKEKKCKVVNSDEEDLNRDHREKLRQKFPAEKLDRFFEAENKVPVIPEPATQEVKMKKTEKTSNSKIPKPKHEMAGKTSREKQNRESIRCQEQNGGFNGSDRYIDIESKSEDRKESDCDSNLREVASVDSEEKLSEIKKKAKKWRNISEMSTEDLLHMTDDFDLPNDPDGDEPCQELSDSAIWEIAAEQFLKSEDSINNATTVASIDSLTETTATKQLVENGPGKNGDDFIVLHVTDPAKLDENDADMKISMSEPCFPYSGDVLKSKDRKRTDVMVFAGRCDEIKKFRRRKSRKKTKKVRETPKMSAIREKTFLANDLPKAKRRKLNTGKTENSWNSTEGIENFFVGDNARNGERGWEDKKKQFLENLKKSKPCGSAQVYKWHVSKDYHFRYLEDFDKSLEEDLQDLKNLFDGKKKPRKSYIKEFKRQKIREKREKKDKIKNAGQFNSEPEKVKSKKYDYIEINLDDDFDGKETPKTSRQKTENKIQKEPDAIRKDGDAASNGSRSSKRECQLLKNEEPEVTKPKTTSVKKCETFEIANETSKWAKPKVGEGKRSERKFDKETTIEEMTGEEKDDAGKSEVVPEERNFRSKIRTSTPKKNLAEPEEVERMSVIKCKLESVEETVPPQKVGHRGGLVKKKSRGFACNDVDNLKWRDGRETNSSESQQTFNNQSSSLGNIEEVDEDEEEKDKNDADVEDRGEEDVGSNIEIEDFIMSKPDSKKILSKEDNCLDGLFPKPKKISGTLAREESTTAVKLDYTANSVYDLKSNEETNLKDLCRLPKGNNSRILQRRLKKGSRLPQILSKNEEKKENSMISLIELWKNKRENAVVGYNDAYKTKGNFPNAKLAPLTNKNSFQIKSDVGDLYEPFKQAERQMLALLSWPSTADIKTAKDFSPKTKRTSNPNSNLETSPGSAFTKYADGKSDKSAGGRTVNTSTTAKRNLNETFVNEVTRRTRNRQEKPTYASPDDWEEIFESHFDLNRNEMADKMSNSIKSALDGLVKNSGIGNSLPEKGKSSGTTPVKNRSDLSDGSIIDEILYTSTPKQNSRTWNKENSVESERSRRPRQKSSADSTYNVDLQPDESSGIVKRQQDDKRNRNSGVSLSSLSFCSQISDTTLADEEVMRSNLEIVGKAAAAVAVSRTPRRKYARSQSVFEERNRMLFAKTYDPNASSSDENDAAVKVHDKQETNKSSPPRNSYPKPVPSHFYRSQSVFDGRCKGDGDHSDDEGGHASPTESGNRNRKGKLSGDSAYSSLNRRSPRRENPPKHVRENRLSSSGSDTSLPAINDAKAKSSADTDHGNKKKADQPVKMSKFCHECGSKYPVAVAKFCCECGVRRLII